MNERETMNRRVITTDRAPLPIGPYSQAIAAGELLFISGQIPLDPADGNIEGSTIGEQAHRALENLFAVLSADRLTCENIVKTTVFLADITDFPEFNRIYEAMLGEARPARSVVAVAGLPKGVRVEIEAIACR